MGRRRLAAAALAVLALGGSGLAAASQAQAYTITGAGTSLTFTGTAGDYIAGPYPYAYDPSNAAFNASASSDGGSVAVDVAQGNGIWWDLNLVAPAGQKLTPGVTYSATRWPFQAPTTAGFDLSGSGRGCNQSTSTFTVKSAVFGPYGWIQSFDATFEQHCENGTDYAAGEVVINNGPAPKQLAVTAVPATSDTVSKISGAVTVAGTVTCNEAGDVALTGTVTQKLSRTKLATGTWQASVHCGTTPTAFTAVAAATGGIPFGVGTAQVDGAWSAVDPVYGVTVGASFSTAVKLTAR